MSLIMSSSNLPDFWIFLGVAFLLVFQRIDGAQHFAESQNAIERRSQFVAHSRQKIALQAVHFVQGHVGLRQLIDLAIEIGVHVPQFFLYGHQVPQHAVECAAQFLEFIAGLNIGPQLDFSLADRVADVL